MLSYPMLCYAMLCYATQASEFSYFMLIASNFILNQLQERAAASQEHMMGLSCESRRRLYATLCHAGARRFAMLCYATLCHAGARRGHRAPVGAADVTEHSIAYGRIVALPPLMCYAVLRYAICYAMLRYAGATSCGRPTSCERHSSIA